jgi:hypothetical protein
MKSAYLDSLKLELLKEHPTECMIRHAAAINSPRTGRERAIVDLISGWLRYADENKRHYERTSFDYGVLSEEWARFGGPLRGLLNGEIGRLDSGALDKVICDTLLAERFEPDEFVPIPSCLIRFRG